LRGLAQPRRAPGLPAKGRPARDEAPRPRRAHPEGARGRARAPRRDRRRPRLRARVPVLVRRALRLARPMRQTSRPRPALHVLGEGRALDDAELFGRGAARVTAATRLAGCALRGGARLTAVVVASAVDEYFARAMAVCILASHAPSSSRDGVQAACPTSF